MNRILSALFVFAFLALASSARADNTVFFGSMITVSNATSNSTSTAVGTAVIPRNTLLIQNGGLLTTNALLVNDQISIDGTNFITVATYGPSRTNATTDTYIPTPTVLTLYRRSQVVTTNSVNIGVILVQ